MQIIGAFFRLIRYPNLLFIAITQYLFFYAVLMPIFNKAVMEPRLDVFYVSLLVMSSVSIAAAGNIINDYFDRNIDHINKPDKVIIGRYIHRHAAISWHILLSCLGIFLGFYIDAKAGTFFLGVTNLCCVVLLFIYSILLKRKPLSGNIVIALLTAWTVVVLPFAETKTMLAECSPTLLVHVVRITLLYACFAFVISLIREVVKDMEDVDGDNRYGCRTFPIIFGLPATKVFVYVWLSILLVLLVAVLVYVAPFRWWLGMSYIFCCVFVPATKVFKRLKRARSPKSFHAVSTYIKWLMLAGILSMLFFRHYS